MESRFEKLLAALVRAEIDFVVVGGIAVVLNGIVRTTDDLDVLVDGAESNLRRLLEALGRVGEGHAHELSLADFADEEGAVRVIEDFPIDIFIRMGGLHYADTTAWHRVTRIDDVDVPYLSPEGLIRLKEKSARARDREDVVRLRALLEHEATGSELTRGLRAWIRRMFSRHR